MHHVTFEQAIEIVRSLLPEERLRLRAWIEEQERQKATAQEKEETSPDSEVS